MVGSRPAQRRRAPCPPPDPSIPLSEQPTRTACAPGQARDHTAPSHARTRAIPTPPAAAEADSARTIWHPRTCEPKRQRPRPRRRPGPTSREIARANPADATPLPAIRTQPKMWILHKRFRAAAHSNPEAASPALAAKRTRPTRMRILHERIVPLHTRTQARTSPPSLRIEPGRHRCGFLHERTVPRHVRTRRPARRPQAPRRTRSRVRVTMPARWLAKTMAATGRSSTP